MDAPRDWTRWSAGGRSTPIRTAHPQPSRACPAPQTLPVLTTTATAGGRGSGAGIAVAGNVSALRLTRLSSSSRAWALVSTAIAPSVERRARENGISAAALQRVPTTLDFVYAIDAPPNGPLYYFEASKRLPDAGNTPEEDPKGIVRVSVSGWLRQTAAGLVPSGTKGELHWDPAEQTGPAAMLTPLGVVREGSGTVWIMADTARRTFVLYAVGDSAVRTLLTVDEPEC